MGGSKAEHHKINSVLSFGGIAAERYPLLSRAYLDNGDYEAFSSRDDPRFIIIGRTSSGKSAAFRHLSEQHPDRVVAIHPEIVSL